MSLPPLQLVNNAGDVFRRLQDNIKSWILALQRFAPIVDGALVPARTVRTVDTLVHTGLDRDALGFIVCGGDANAVVYLSPNNAAAPTGTLILRASAQVTVTLWVF